MKNSWKALYPSVILHSSHGFTPMLKLRYETTKEDFLRVLKEAGVDEAEIKKMADTIDASGKKQFVWDASWHILNSDNIYPILRYYLNTQCTGTFAIGQERTNFGANFYMGFKNPKDAFTMSLRFSSVTKTNMFPVASFYVRVSKDDNQEYNFSDWQDREKRREDPQRLI